MRRALMFAYVFILALVVLQVAAPQAKPQPDEPMLWLLVCEYDEYGHLLRFWCCEEPTLYDCVRQNCIIE